MANESVLVVEDEEDILELVRFNLVKEGYRVFCARTGEQALHTARTQQPDVVVLDLLLPGIDGLEVCRLLKRDARTETMPIVMLTAKSEDADVVTGLEVGADDYITKPFSTKVLIARVRAVLRRSAAGPADEEAVLRLDGIEIDPGRFEVRLDGHPVELTATQFRVLHHLARRPGWVFTRAQIVDAVHGEDYAVTDRSIDVHIVALRRSLGDYGDRIETVRGVGYRFRG